MLESIQIKNFAIIDALQLEFSAGLSALTGATGAGKSILLDALKLVAGDRADNDSIRNGTDRAEISACFRLDDAQAAQKWLQDNEMNAEAECVVRRILHLGGRSKAFINGYQATLAQLRALCDLLIDIHGQHEHQSLQKTPVQRQLLDAFLGDPDLIDQVRQRFEAYKDLSQRLEQIRSGSEQRMQRIDLLTLYSDELAQLSLVEGEFQQLQDEYRRLANAGNLIRKTDELHALLYENDTHNLQSELSYCEHELSALLESDKALVNCHELIAGALAQVQEATTELRSYRSDIELDTTRLETLNSRIAEAQDLARKHHVGAEELAARYLEMQQELQDLQSESFDADSIQSMLDKARDEYLFSATELSSKRKQTAAMLSEQISQVMRQLGMDGGHFVIDFQSDQAPAVHGIDEIRYLVSANPGQPPKSLARVASGGELSRISLAIQVIMSESSQIPTLIFDEVDSGVGGGIAEIVGKKLRLLGRERQVFCVTHLPQVASQAHHHFRVEKNSRPDTTTEVVALDTHERLEEVARMLGGIEITAQTRAHASEMIANQE